VGKLLFGLFDHDDEGTRMLSNVGNFDPNNTAQLFSHLFICVLAQYSQYGDMVTRMQAGQSVFKSPWQPEILLFSRGPTSLLCNRYNSSFSGYKLASAQDRPLTSFWCQGYEWVEEYLNSPCRPS